MLPEIILLAMIAAFLGLRLYSVLGRRAEHEEESIAQRSEAGDKASAPPVGVPQPAQPTPQRVIEMEGVMPAVERGIRDIASRGDPERPARAWRSGHHRAQCSPCDSRAPRPRYNRPRTGWAG